MKITDTVGRSMLVDLMYKDASLWNLAPEHKLQGRGTRYVEVPYGSEFAVKIESITGADVLVFENGKRLIGTTVPAQTQYVTADSEGQSFTFRRDGDGKSSAAVTDIKVHEDSGNAAGSSSTAESDAIFSGPQPLKGNGMVYVIVRFAKQNSPYGEPPQEEFEIAFQMMDKEAAEKHFAENFHLIEQAPALANHLDPFSRTPPTEGELAHRPCIHCTFGHDHKH